MKTILFAGVIGLAMGTAAFAEADKGSSMPVESMAMSQEGGSVTVGGAPMYACLLYTSPSPRDQRGSRMPSSA